MENCHGKLETPNNTKEKKKKKRPTIILEEVECSIPTSISRLTDYFFSENISEFSVLTTFSIREGLPRWSLYLTFLVRGT